MSPVVDLLGVADLVKLLGVSKTRVEQFVKEPGFPVAHRVGAQGVRVWDRGAIVEWAESRSRPRRIYSGGVTPTP